MVRSQLLAGCPTPIHHDHTPSRKAARRTTKKNRSTLYLSQLTPTVDRSRTDNVGFRIRRLRYRYVHFR